MEEKNKEVVQRNEQPEKSFHTNNSIPPKTNNLMTSYDLFDEELQQEAKLVAFQDTSSFPYTLLPEPIARFIDETAKALTCPPDFLGIGVLVCASAAIGNGAVLELKKAGGLEPVFTVGW